jgi:2-keto-4-pentenoate hydratase/2-oxohepta-3-ene-1,7-dioic acid hydratase in catechol pathway
LIVKALSYRIDDRATYGLLADGLVYEATRPFRLRHDDLRAVLRAGALALLPENLEPRGIAEAEVEYLPLIPRPDKVICVGVNYRPHAEEMGRPLPEHPLLFVRFAGSQVGHRQALVHPGLSAHYDYEGELAVIIGKPARHVQRAQAFDVVAGYSCFMDGSVRDWQQHSSQFTAGKNFWRSGALGPWLVTHDEIPDPASLTLCTRINGELMQEGRLADLIFDIPTLIAYCSSFAELSPGDVLVTGTPGGVGAAKRPPCWLAPGDRVEIDLGAVGVLCNTVATG